MTTKYKRIQKKKENEGNQIGYILIHHFQQIYKIIYMITYLILISVLLDFISSQTINLQSTTSQQPSKTSSLKIGSTPQQIIDSLNKITATTLQGQKTALDLTTGTLFSATLEQLQFLSDILVVSDLQPSLQEHVLISLYGNIPQFGTNALRDENLQFDKFLLQYQKKYQDPNIYKYRETVFLENVNKIRLFNNNPIQKFLLGINQFTDLTEPQFTDIYANLVQFPEDQQITQPANGNRRLQQEVNISALKQMNNKNQEMEQTLNQTQTDPLTQSLVNFINSQPTIPGALTQPETNNLGSTPSQIKYVSGEPSTGRPSSSLFDTIIANLSGQTQESSSATQSANLNPQFLKFSQYGPLFIFMRNTIPPNYKLLNFTRSYLTKPNNQAQTVQTPIKTNNNQRALTPSYFLTSTIGIDPIFALQLYTESSNRPPDNKDFFPSFIPELLNGVLIRNLQPIAYDIPNNFSTIDWTCNSGEVHNQGACGSCYAFSAADTVAAVYSIYDTIFPFYIRLSVEQLISCVPRKDNGCQGGTFQETFDYIQKSGLSTSNQYPYDSGFRIEPSPCKIPLFIKPRLKRRITSYKVHKNDCLSILKDLQKIPIAAGISSKNLQFYMTGIFNAPANSQIDHAVVIVGYDPSYGFKIKNMWGKSWGQLGFGWVDIVENGGLCQKAITINTLIDNNAPNKCGSVTKTPVNTSSTPTGIPTIPGAPTAPESSSTSALANLASLFQGLRPPVNG